MEVRGMPMTSFITPSGRRQLSDALEEVFQRPAVCELRLAAESGRDKPVMDARIILLPLKSDLGDVSRILGCFVAQGDIGRSPRRFDVVGVKIRPISASAAAPETQEPKATPKPAAIPTQIKGFSEDKPSFEPAPTKKPPAKGGDIPYLRLVKSED